VAAQPALKARRAPQRTCVACRSTTAKRQLVRIVRTPQGSVELDATGKKAGRGAYLCHETACWELGVSKGKLEHALKTKLSPRDREALLAYAPVATAGGAA